MQGLLLEWCKTCYNDWTLVFNACLWYKWGFLGSLAVTSLPAMQEALVRSLGDPLEKGMATHSSTLAWGMPWTEGPGRTQSMRSRRVRYNLAVKQQQIIKVCNIRNKANISLYLCPDGRYQKFWIILELIFTNKNTPLIQ